MRVATYHFMLAEWGWSLLSKSTQTVGVRCLAPVTCCLTRRWEKHFWMWRTEWTSSTFFLSSTAAALADFSRTYINTDPETSVVSSVFFKFHSIHKIALHDTTLNCLRQGQCHLCNASVCNYHQDAHKWRWRNFGSVSGLEQRGGRVSGSDVAECAKAGWHSTVWPGSLRPHHYIEVSARWWWHLGAGAELRLPWPACHMSLGISERALQGRRLTARHSP